MVAFTITGIKMDDLGIEWTSFRDAMPPFDKLVEIEVVNDRIHKNCRLDYYSEGEFIGFWDEYLEDFIPFRDVLAWRYKG